MIRESRLRRSADFAAVHRRGRAVSGEALVLRSLRTGAPTSRIGFSIGKRVGNAVVRNRVKRRLRAAVTALPVLPGWDLVIIARPVAAARDYAGLHAALTGLLKKARLLRTSEGRPPAATVGAKDGRAG